RKIKPRLEAVVLRPAAGTSYAEIVSGIRGKVNPDEHGTDIKTVRHTQSGDVLIEIKRGTKEGKEAFRNALKLAVSEKAVLRPLIPRAHLEIRDLDSCATDEEVKGARLSILLDYEGPLETRLTRPNKFEQRMAIVTLSEEAADALLQREHIRIGWVSCRIRDRPIAERCYK
ncbi:hypothetical protein JGE71_25850, partial [Salmonella enterica subsp. enterica serovar Typhimurium]|nr:hypothetical protein [Salmonella enterica subsp. enterica serovar Typhimurium]